MAVNAIWHNRTGWLLAIKYWETKYNFFIDFSDNWCADTVPFLDAKVYGNLDCVKASLEGPITPLKSQFTQTLAMFFEYFDSLGSQGHISWRLISEAAWKTMSKQKITFLLIAMSGILKGPWSPPLKKDVCNTSRRKKSKSMSHLSISYCVCRNE